MSGTCSAAIAFGRQHKEDPLRKTSKVWALVALASLTLLVAILAVLASARSVSWRVAALRLKASDSLPDVSWTDLFRMIGRRHNPYHLDRIIETPNPYLVIDDPFDSPADIAMGKDLFRAHCAGCHGADGLGSNTGPNLRGRQMTQGSTDWALFRTITFGVRGTAMPANQLSESDKWRLVAFVKSVMLPPTASRSGTSIAGSGLSSLPPVSYEKILSSAQDSNDWLTYSGSYDSHRYSPDIQITPLNASKLRLLWMRQYTTTEQSIETSPLVVGGYMFVTAPPSRVEALDAKTGVLIWSYDRALPANISVCCGVVNRGLAVLGSTLFFGTTDAHLVALDIKTGNLVWDERIADYRLGYSITGAPLTLKNAVLTGVSGGEYGIRGFITARDATTGKEIWRFNTIPAPGESGSETWSGDSWKTGGAPTWMTGSFDPVTNLLYWPTGNPSPNFEGNEREGINLYTNSIVALDADRGTLQWYFQFTPHDLFDWDANEIVLLFDDAFEGQHRKLLAQANRNGFYYLLDRETGHLVLARAFAKTTWSSGVDALGRPAMRDSAVPTTEGVSLYPGVGGATNWYSPSYSPRTGLMYVPELDWGGTYYSGTSKYRAGEQFPGGFFQYFKEPEPQGAVRALNPVTGTVQWEYRQASTELGGVLSTAGGVVFGSLAQSFFALDARSGQELWRVGTGGRIVAAPISYMCGGKQMVTIAAGHDLLTFGF